MTSYDAFDRRRLRHTIDPGTPAVALEAGFLGGPGDRRVLVEASRLAGHAFADGVVAFPRRGRASA